jgi:ribosome biogenesis GTPase A
MNKEILKEIKNFKSTEDSNYINYNTNEFMDLIYKNNLEEYTEDIYNDEQMIEYLQHYLKESGWLTVKNMLSDINDVTENYYIKDAYGCFNNVTNGDIEYIVDNIEYDLNNEEVEL